MTEDFNEALLGADEADLEKLLPAKDRNDKEKEATEKIMLIESNHSKFYLGIFLLIVVDVLWVASSEISSYLFNNMQYDKPYMSTYVKVSMFSLYLFGFVAYPPWRRQFIRCACDDYPGQYQLLGETDTDTDDGSEYQIKDTLGESVFVPAKLPEVTEEAVASKVKFNEVAEVRQLEDNTASYIARLNYGSSVRARLLLKREKGKFTIHQVMRISLLFSVVFFLGNVAYQESLSVSQVAIVNIFSATSSIFTLLLSALFPTSHNDEFSVSKLFAVLTSVIGLVVVVLGSGSETAQDYFNSELLGQGIMWALLGSFCYALYLVVFRKTVGSENNIDVPMFFGFVGLFTMSLLWPGLLLLHYAGVEQFQLPNQTQILFLAVNGLIGTVFAELLWLWGCMLTSSLYGTMSLSLTIPLSIAVDIIFRQATYSWMFLVGVVPVFISVVTVGVLSHKPHYNPVQTLMSCVYAATVRSSR